MPQLQSLVLLVLLLASARVVHAGVSGTAHDLSATGPAPASETANACVFCHTPHSAVTTRALWNRELPTVAYQLYESSTLGVELRQPTGATRLCLSCHDGTLALGAMRTHPDPDLGPLTGPSVLGTDLSDDHPVSFVYDSQVAARLPELVHPSALTGPVKLDSTEQMQCTTCHDPHEERYPHFLVTDTAYSQLCISCHQKRMWDGSSHATSVALWNGIPPDPWPDSDFVTVAENGCENCHKPHAAPAPERLLAALPEENVCYPCHSGHVASKNIEREFFKSSAHPVESQRGVHDPTEDPLTMPQHVECVDCHNPHQARTSSVIGNLPGPLTGSSGTNISGGSVLQATFEYEVCLKCHGLVAPGGPLVIRQDDINNVRVKIDPTNPSYHPVADAGRNPTIDGLLPGYTPSSIISCSDCHSSDTVALGQINIRGPHGSLYDPILARSYEISGGEISESFQTYALCYYCHNRNALLSEGGDKFPHGTHVEGAQASCAICHDAHGSRSHPRLINFMLRDQAGLIVVKASASSNPANPGTPEFLFLGEDSGECFLTCHGKDHAPEGYGPGR